MPANLARCRRAWRMAPPRQGVGLFLRNFHVWLIGPRVFLKGRWYHRRVERVPPNDDGSNTSACILIASFMAVLLSYRRHRRYSPPSAKCEGLRRESERASEVNTITGEKGERDEEDPGSWIFHVSLFLFFSEDGVERTSRSFLQGVLYRFEIKELRGKLCCFFFPPSSDIYFEISFFFDFVILLFIYLTCVKFNNCVKLFDRDLIGYKYSFGMIIFLQRLFYDFKVKFLKCDILIFLLQFLFKFLYLYYPVFKTQRRKKKVIRTWRFRY